MTAYANLMAEDAPDPAALLADKGYDSDAVRDDIEARGGKPVIPTKSNRKVQRPVDPAAYALRNRIERFFNKLKQFRHICTRFHRHALNYLAMAKLASVRLWLRHYESTA